MGTGLAVGPGSGVCVPLRPGVGLAASLVGVRSSQVLQPVSANLGNPHLQLHLRHILHGRREHVDCLEAGSLDDALHLRGGFRIAHAAGKHHRAIRLAQPNIVLREERADLRIDQREIGSHVDIEYQISATGLFPGDEVHLAKCLAVDDYLIRRHEYRLGNFGIRDREAPNRFIEVNYARLAHKSVHCNGLFVLLEERPI